MKQKLKIQFFKKLRKKQEKLVRVQVTPKIEYFKKITRKQT